MFMCAYTDRCSCVYVYVRMRMKKFRVYLCVSVFGIYVYAQHVCVYRQHVYVSV